MAIQVTKSDLTNNVAICLDVCTCGMYARVLVGRRVVEGGGFSRSHGPPFTPNP